MRRLVFLFFVSCLSACFAFSDCNTVLVGVKELDNGGFEGVLANLTVRIAPGSGNVWVDTMPLSKVETQVSARLAREVGCELLGINCSGLDFYYVMRSDYSMVGGPSAGGAMAVCTLAALLNRTVYSDVAMTGTINPDGSIGSVGAVLDKAGVLSDYRLFLVPVDSLIDGSNLSVGVVGVSDVVEAFNYFTGLDLVLGNASEGEVVSSDYVNAMRFMSDSLLGVAREELAGVEAGVLLNESVSFYNNGSFYSSASLSVRSLIYSFYEQRLSYVSNDSYVSGMIYDLSSSLNSSKRDFMSRLVIDHVYDLEGIAITLERYREAEELIDEARDFLESGEGDALFSACFAKARLITAVTWSGLLDFFKDSNVDSLDIESIRPLVFERMENARNSIAYAETIIDSSLLGSAQAHLDDALVAYYNGDLFYALFESLKSRAEANLVMELRGAENVSSKIDFKKASALRSIKSVMERGFLPLSSLSFLEYSDAFESDPIQAVVFLAYSNEFASLGPSLNDFIKYFSESGVPVYSLSVPVNYSFYSSLLLVILGFVLGLVAVSIGLRQ